MGIEGLTIDNVDRVSGVETKTSFLKGEVNKRLVVFRMLKNIERPGEL